MFCCALTAPALTWGSCRCRQVLSLLSCPYRMVLTLLVLQLLALTDHRDLTGCIGSSTDFARLILWWASMGIPLSGYSLLGYSLIPVSRLKATLAARHMNISSEENDLPRDGTACIDLRGHLYESRYHWSRLLGQTPLLTPSLVLISSSCRK